MSLATGVGNRQSQTSIWPRAVEIVINRLELVSARTGVKKVSGTFFVRCLASATSKDSKRFLTPF